MSFIAKQLELFKNIIEEAIHEQGSKGKTSVIRSSHLINLIHDAVKYELINKGVDPSLIMPNIYQCQPEIRLAGFLKQKDQDVCVLPRYINKQKRFINWGPLAFLNKIDVYGQEFSTNTLVINVRSQMSSLKKNADTLFERTFAEALNLHMQYPDIVLGEVYLIPLYEYDAAAEKKRQVRFSDKQTDVERYISFFNSINRRKIGEANYKYERCALLIVDFRPEQPILFRNTQELKEIGAVSENFNIEAADLGFDTFVEDLLSVYSDRYDIQNLLKDC